MFVNQRIRAKMGGFVNLKVMATIASVNPVTKERTAIKISMNVLSTIHVRMEERALTPLEATNAHAEQSTPEETAKRMLTSAQYTSLVKTEVPV